MAVATEDETTKSVVKVEWVKVLCRELRDTHRQLGKAIKEGMQLTDACDAVLGFPTKKRKTKPLSGRGGLWPPTRNPRGPNNGIMSTVD
ncbi:hypothetical protein MUK42_33025 [Musa troglodytarum]|uniref:Uncharacterized protein n=1 Tax=Musa troglodytarum TaxID=320322 RepID=A0A9E7FC21_9LILI|nr:hypothetical protein MUK42_33025 [Musa troglodytarum]